MRYRQPSQLQEDRDVEASLQRENDFYRKYFFPETDDERNEREAGPNPSGLCMCGCGQAAPVAPQTHRRYGWVRGTPKKFIRGHRRKLTPYYLVEDRGFETPCWVWQRSLRDGYGVLKNERVQGNAHRIYYERANGPVPDGLQLDHLCRVRACVNPDHLEPVTHLENCRRGVACKLTREQAGEILALRGTQTQEAVGRLFGVSRYTVGLIWSGRTWKEVQP